MITDFIKFVDAIVPVIREDEKDQLIAEIRQFESEGHKITFLRSCHLEELAQGDVLSNIAFSFYNQDGQQNTFKADAMVISTSCHIDQKDKLILAPLLPITACPNKDKELKSNKIYDYMYIPDEPLSEKFVDFTIFCTYSRDLIMRAISLDQTQCLASLNQMGYYFFVVKLSIYLMRREDAQTLLEREQEID